MADSFDPNAIYADTNGLRVSLRGAPHLIASKSNDLVRRRRSIAGGSDRTA
jgi:hypothetical protein